MNRRRLLLASLAGAATTLTAVLFIWVAQPLIGTPPPIPVPAADAQRLRNDVVRLSGEFGLRHHNRPDVLDKAARFIRDRFAAAGGNAVFQSYEVNGATYRNVVGRFGPRVGNPVVVGAHYDAEEHTAGADDNASGVAGLLELARLLGQQPPAVPVELVAYTLEEPPHFRHATMGSRHHADELVAAGSAPRLVVILEMIGCFYDLPGSQDYPVSLLKAIYPDRGDFIAVIGHMAGTAETRRVKAAMSASAPLPVWSVNAPAWLPGVDFSDHSSYWRHGIPAVMVTDTAFYRNHRYHRSDDTPETLDYRRMAHVVSGVVGVIRDSERDRRP